MKTTHKAGFVNIVGNPNAGKSTLMNALLGEKLSIVTPKAQTTRHRVMGILNGPDYQIVYSDTPGVLDPRYKLQEGMMKAVGSALVDADLLLLVVDLTDQTPIQSRLMENLKKTDVQVFVLLNKVDVAGFEKSNEAFQYWNQELPKAKIFPVSALGKIYTQELMTEILAVLPESPPYFPKDELSDRSMRFFVSEIIREKILLLYDREIPYACEVVVNEFKEEENITRISATIYTERESQKRILIGHQGSMMKRLGTKARHDIEPFVGKKVFLELHVKVDDNWRNDIGKLRTFGYLDGENKG